MKLKDWVAVHKSLYNGDLAIKVFKKMSYKKEDIVLETIANPSVCSQFFGEFEVAKIGVYERPSGNGTTVGALLWPTITNESE